MNSRPSRRRILGRAAQISLAVCIGTGQTGVVLAGLASPARAVTLISEEEARRPAADAAAGLDQRAITRGPTIKVISPSGLTTTSPLALKVAFEPRGGSSINVAAVTVTYLRSPAVDLTERLRPFITAGGIALEAADVPAGRHAVRIEVRDAEGRRSASIVTFTVRP